MVVDEGADVVVPPSVHALLTARLELLPEAERAALAAASVAGRFFSSHAVAALAGEDAVAALPALERKDRVRPYEGEYRVRHMLIRDAAYESLPKALRADLHLRLADWLERTATPSCPATASAGALESQPPAKTLPSRSAVSNRITRL